ncbi:MAG: tetratricopeptide repeat protein [Bacteroidaceae bacterium]|nr:tetratricopeptide repeat protein [Bacteroidaceae bacterium]
MAKKENGKVVAEEAIGLDVQLNKAEAAIEKNWKIICGVLVALVVVVTAGFLWKQHMDSVEEEAQKAIAASQSLFLQQQYDQALKGDGANSAGFLKIINDYSGTKTANVAKLYAAICYANTGKTDDAIKMFEDFDQKDDQMISPVSIAALGNCYIQKGQNDKGVELIVKAAKTADNDAISPALLLQAGAVYEGMNQADKALELYNEIKTKYYLSPVAQDIDKYIERVSK